MELLEPETQLFTKREWQFDEWIDLLLLRDSPAARQTQILKKFWNVRLLHKCYAHIVNMTETNYVPPINSQQHSVRY